MAKSDEAKVDGEQKARHANHGGALALAALLHVADVVGDVIALFRRHRCDIVAAGIAYFALLSLIPFLIVGASVVGFVLADKAGNTDPYSLIAGQVTSFLPFLEGELASRLRELVEARRVTGLVGLPTLLATSTLFFGAIERAVGAIFRRGRKPRRFWKRQTLAIAFVPAMVLLLGLAHYGRLVVRAFAAALPGKVPEVGGDLISVLVSVLVLGTGFAVVVVWFGSRKLRFRHVAAGSGLFCALWMVAESAFRAYLEMVTTFSLIYGSLSTLMVMVLWVYYGALVFLLSCCVTQALHDRYPLSAGAEEAT